MIINETIFNDNLFTILNELRNQLRLNNIPLIEKDPKKSGSSWQIQCPYHGNGLERRPSAGIRESDGMFHCFACNEVHTFPELISHCFGHEDNGIFGWQWLLKNFLTIEVEERKDVEIDFSRHNVSNKSGILDNSNSNQLTYVAEEELDRYRYIHPYMYKRGLTDNVIERFDIGYDKNTRCITFPVRDISGNTLFIARRSVVSKYFNYPEGVEKPLYGLYEYNMILQSCVNRFISGGRGNGKTAYLKSIGELIICESMLDALSFWVIGKYAVALNGTGSELQFKQLRDLPCRKLILATDSDEAGQRARDKIRKNVKNKLITEYIFPEGRKDANECTIEELKNLQEVF